MKGPKGANGKPINLYWLPEIIEELERTRGRRAVQVCDRKVVPLPPLISGNDEVCLKARWRLWANNNRKWDWKSIDRRKAAG